MKYTLLILTFLFILACNRADKEAGENLITAHSITSDFSGIITQRDYKILYDEQSRVKQIRFQEIEYGDTTIADYTIEFGSKGQALKVYRQYLKSFRGADSIPELSIEFEYEDTTLKSISYDMVILGDIEYAEGNLRSVSYHYFDYISDRSKAIDTTRTLKLEIETDSRGNVTRITDKKRKIVYNDVNLSYDSTPNPFYLNILSLIPEPDFISYFSRNNWKQEITHDDLKKAIFTRTISYNEANYPTIIKSEDEFGLITTDSITYMK